MEENTSGRREPGARLSEALDPRIKAVWRITDSLWLTVFWLCAAGVGALVLLVADALDSMSVLCFACLIGWAVSLVAAIAFIAPLRYLRWRYELRPDFLEIESGIFWRTHTVVPFIRVQNTDTKQGPIMRAFGLMSVTVSSAAGSKEIPGLEAAKAAQVRDRAAEFARLAREDV